MIIVDCIDNLLFALLQYLPNGSAYDMTSRQRRYLQALSFSFQIDRLRIFELLNLLEAQINVVQSEQVKVFMIWPRLFCFSLTKLKIFSLQVNFEIKTQARVNYQEQVVHEHLAHFKHWHSRVYRTVKAAFADQVGQSAYVLKIGIWDQNSVHAPHVSLKQKFKILRFKSDLWFEISYFYFLYSSIISMEKFSFQPQSSKNLYSSIWSR